MEPDTNIELSAEDIIVSFKTQIAEMSARHSEEIARRDAYIKKLAAQLASARQTIDQLAPQAKED